MSSVVGVWRLVTTSARDDAGAPLPPPYGPEPMGLITFTSTGRMMAVLCDGRVHTPQGETVREYNSYCGAYTFDGETLVTRVDGATKTERIGGDQVRGVRFEANRMIITPPPRAWRDETRRQHRELVWERIA